MPFLIAIAIGMVRHQQSAVVALRVGDRRPVVRLLVRHLIAAGWLLLMATASCVADDGGREARQGVLDLRGWNPVEDAPVRLNGEWRVAWGRLAGGETSDGDWATVWLPGTWTGQAGSDGDERPAFGLATYRLRLLLPDGAPSLTLRVSQIKSAARVWVNGRPLFSVGTVGRDAATEVPLPLTRFLTLPAGLTTADLAIEVSNHFHFEGGINRSIMLDGNGQLQRDWHLIQLMCAGVVMALLVLAIFLTSFLQPGMPRTSAVLALLLIVVATRQAANSELVTVFIPNISMTLLYRLGHLPNYMYWPFYFYVFDKLLPGRMYKPVKWGLTAASVLCCLVVMTTEPVIFTQMRDIASFLIVLSVTYFTGLLMIAIWQGQPGARLLGAGMLVLLGSVSHDALVYANVIEGVDLSSFGVLVFMLTHSMLQSRRVVYAMHDVSALSTKLAALNEGLERQVEDRTRELVEKSVGLQHLLANLSHEVRTPLNAILGTVRLALRDRSLDRLKRVEGAGQHLVRLLDSSLEIARLEVDATPIRPKPTKAGEAVRAAVELLRTAAEAKGLALELVVGPGQPPRCLVDPLALEQIVVNLVTNAVKFTDDGGVYVRLDFRAADDHLVLSVADTGPGIPLAARGIIFQAFRRAGNGHRDGVGLGLAIVRTLVAAMEGGVELDDRPGGGTVFTVTIPARPVPAPEAERTTGPRFELTRALDILLVEDAPENQVIMLEYLRPGGHRVHCAGDGPEALERVMSGAFDVVLLDMRLPGMSGIEVAQRIRAHGDNTVALVPIIAVTANVALADRAEYMEAGVDEVLPKPVEPDRLVEALIRHAPASAVAKASWMEAGPPPDIRRAVPLFAEACRDALVLMSEPRPDAGRLAAVAHRIKGSAAAFGFAEVSAHAATLERALHPAERTTSVLAEVANLRTAITSLLQTLESGTMETPER